MVKYNKKSRIFTLSERVRKKLRDFQISDKLELALKSNDYRIALRRRLQDQFPDLRPDEIEVKFRAIVAHGMRRAKPDPARSAPKYAPPPRRKSRGGRAK